MSLNLRFQNPGLAAPPDYRYGQSTDFLTTESEEVKPDL